MIIRRIVGTALVGAAISAATVGITGATVVGTASSADALPNRCSHWLTLSDYYFDQQEWDLSMTFWHVYTACLAG
jgi:hypothetical protein